MTCRLLRPNSMIFVKSVVMVIIVKIIFADLFDERMKFKGRWENASQITITPLRFTLLEIFRFIESYQPTCYSFMSWKFNALVGLYYLGYTYVATSKPYYVNCSLSFYLKEWTSGNFKTTRLGFSRNKTTKILQLKLPYIYISMEFY